LVPRTGQPNYVEFRTGGGCAAIIGMVGGPQYVELSPSTTACPVDAVIHEIGHAFGMLHEQSRKDRNQWVNVLYENIDSYTFSQFSQERDGLDRGYYDYDSIMHYNWYAFSLDGLTSLESVPPGIPFGDVKVLSAADIDGISRAYGFIPTTTTVTTIPAGLKITVDGTQFTSPHAFSWGPGSSHTISVAETQPSGTGALKIRNQFVRWTDGGAPEHTFTASADQTVVAAEFQQWFPVAPTASGPGTVTLEPASPDGYYRGGSTITIRAFPNSGAALHLWTGNDPEFYTYGNAAEVLRIPVREVITFQANFTLERLVTVTSPRPGLAVLVDGAPYLMPARFYWLTGTQHTLSFNNPQYDFTDSVEFSFDGWADGPLSPIRTVTATDTPATYTATFRPAYYLNYDWSGPGFVDPSPFDSYYNEGSLVTLTATPFANQTLQFWLGDTTGGGVTKSLRMDAPRFAKAVFGPRLDLVPSNAASFSTNPVFEEGGLNVAPLEIVAIFGDNVGPPGAFVNGFIDSNGRLATTVGNTRILFDDVPAPIVYTSQTVSSVIVPAEVAGKTFTVITVVRDGVASTFGTATVVDTLPGIYTVSSNGLGNIVAFNQDGTLNSPSNPAAPDSVVVFYGTGGGLMDRTLPNGAVTGFDLARPLAPVSVRIGSDTGKLEYAGSVPSLVHGGLQLNVRIPKELTTGIYPIFMVVGNNRSAPGATISIK
jgi:uncharacterized protein (TIGR03437 family)